MKRPNQAAFLHRHRLTALAIVWTAAMLIGCHRQPSPAATAQPLPAAATAQAKAFYTNSFGKTPTVSAMTQLGRLMFFDVSLSRTGTLACATCHDPKFAYGPPIASTRPANAARIPSGTRAIPSLRYIQTVPPFSEHHFDEAIDESVDQGPTGGHTWDGRADTVHDQARLPLFSATEMANVDSDAVVLKVKASVYADLMRETFGSNLFADNERAFKAILMSLEVFQQSPADFYPYDSKYDAWLRGEVKLTAAETRGLKAFSDPAKGNCSSCHPSQIQNGSFPQFTDYGFIALGVPRNPAIAENHDPYYFDLGLCGPQRTDLVKHAEYCGRFRAPSLRNVSRREVFFHNGAFRSLRKAIEFYAQRDTNPEKYYPRGHGGEVDKFDDLPAAYRTNVNMEPPFGGMPKDKPSLSAQDVTDMLAFLGTLSDGYRIPARRLAAANRLTAPLPPRPRRTARCYSAP